MQSAMALTVFWVLLASTVFDGMLSVSAYPVSAPQSDVPTHILSAKLQESSLIPAILHDHKSESYETTPPEAVAASVNVKITDGNQLPKRDESEPNEDGETHDGINPNIIAGIALGATFGTLLIIGALMYAFRVGWEKGQKQNEKVIQQAPSQPPATPVLGHWNQMNVIKPPDVVLETGSSCWDGGSWSCCDDHTEKFRTLGERYSFRPGKGVYEIQEKDLEKGNDTQEVWSTGGSSRADSGLGLGEEGKGKGHEKL